MTSRRANGPLVLLCAFMLSATSCRQPADLDISRKFQDAEECFAKADSQDDFLHAGNLFQQILDARFVSSAVLYNQGNAWDWHRFERTTHGVITGDEVTVRKGNSDNYESAFTEPLAEGTEFILLDRCSDWLHIRIPNSSTGWLAERDAVVY